MARFYTGGGGGGFLSAAARVLTNPQNLQAKRDIAAQQSQDRYQLQGMKEQGLWGRTRLIEQNKMNRANMAHTDKLLKFMSDDQYRNDVLDFNASKFGIQSALQQQATLGKLAYLAHKMKMGELSYKQRERYNNMLYQRWDDLSALHQADAEERQRHNLAGEQLEAGNLKYKYDDLLQRGALGRGKLELEAQNVASQSALRERQGKKLDIETAFLPEVTQANVMGKYAQAEAAKARAEASTRMPETKAQAFAYRQERNKIADAKWFYTQKFNKTKSDINNIYRTAKDASTANKMILALKTNMARSLMQSQTFPGMVLSLMKQQSPDADQNKLALDAQANIDKYATIFSESIVNNALKSVGGYGVITTPSMQRP